MTTENVDQSMDTRRIVRDQEQKMDAAFRSVMSPLLQASALMMTMWGESLITIASTINRWNSGQQSLLRQQHD